MTGARAPSQEDDLLAAEYVLGVQDAETRATLEQRIKRDAVFAGLVTNWENRLAGLNEDYIEEPAPDLLPKIEAQLFPVMVSGGRRRLGWFAYVTAAAAAVAIALAAFIVENPLRPGLAPLLITLASADLAYEVRADGTTLHVKRVLGGPAPAGEVHELWLIAPGASPVSLGLLGDAPLQVAYPVPPAGWALAVSVEPAGGAPRSLPSGPVILANVIGS